MELGLAPTQSHGDFLAMQSQSQLAEAMGFSRLWAHEHHSAAMMYPDPIMALAAMAACTGRIGLGTNMLLLPIHHPVRVAQSGAMLDVLSGGRFTLGVANGYSATDMKTFGVDPGERGVRLSEGIDLIRALWSGQRVTGRGRGFDLEKFTLFPVPIQRPGPPILVGGHAEVAIRRAARLGDGYLISTTTDRAQLPALVASYRQALDAEGKVFDGVSLNRIVCAVRNSREKRTATTFYARALLSLYDSWGHSNITGLPPLQRTEQALADSKLIIGEPAECLELIQQYAAYGVKHMACLTSFGAPDARWVETSTQLLGEQVIPALS